MSFYRLTISYLLIILFSILNLPLGQAKVVYNTISTNIEQYAPPVEKKKKRKKNFRPRKHPNQTQADIVFNLYITFAIMLLLPIVVITGILMAGIGFPLLSFLGIGIGLIALGNIAVIIAGKVAGTSKTYSTQTLNFALWVLFMINLIGGIVLLLLNLFVFAGAVLVWGLVIGLFVFALLFLIWALLINQQNKAFRNRGEEEIK